MPVRVQKCLLVGDSSVVWFCRVHLHSPRPCERKVCVSGIRLLSARLHTCKGVNMGDGCLCMCIHCEGVRVRGCVTQMTSMSCKCECACVTRFPACSRSQCIHRACAGSVLHTLNPSLLSLCLSLALSHTHTHTDAPSLTLSQIYFPKPSPLLLFFPPFSPPPLSFRSLLLRLRFTITSSPISHLSPLICYTSSDQATSTPQHLKRCYLKESN